MDNFIDKNTDGQTGPSYQAHISYTYKNKCLKHTISMELRPS